MGAGQGGGCLSLAAAFVALFAAPVGRGSLSHSDRQGHRKRIIQIHTSSWVFRIAAGAPCRHFLNQTGKLLHTAFRSRHRSVGGGGCWH